MDDPAVVSEPAWKAFKQLDEAYAHTQKERERSKAGVALSGVGADLLSQNRVEGSVKSHPSVLKELGAAGSFDPNVRIVIEQRPLLRLHVAGVNYGGTPVAKYGLSVDGHVF